MTFHQPDSLPNRGFTLIIAVAIMAIVMAVGVSLLDYTNSSRKVVKRYEVAVNTLQLAEAGIQKALYCLNADTGTNCGGSYGDLYGGESGISLNGGTINVTVSGSGEEREITAVGIGPTGESTTVKTKATVPLTTNTDTRFDYAMMVLSGATVNNNAEINNGPVYSNANFTCGNNATIEGDIFISLAGGKLDNCDVGGDAHADMIEDSDIEGDCYYFNSWVRSDCEGSLHSGQSTPVAQTLPTLDENLWHAQAEAGGIIEGDYSPADNSTLGPVKINGNLTLSNNRDVIMLGPIWVTGNISLSNNATITLDSSFGNTGSVLMADGTVLLSNNSQVTGNGESGSYVVVYTPSTASPAINVENNAGTAVYLAPNGRVTISNNGAAVAVAAKYVTMSNNAVINYEEVGVLTELELLIDSASPDGWQLDAGSWREL